MNRGDRAAGQSPPNARQESAGQVRAFMRDVTSTGLAQALAALQPFLQVVRELGPLANDPEACDFLAGNPEQPALPGYVETLQKWAVPTHRRWFAYGFGDSRARGAAAAALEDELGLAF